MKLDWLAKRVASRVTLSANKERRVANAIGQSTSADSRQDAGVAVTKDGRASTEHSLASIYSVVQSELQEVEATIGRELKSESPEVEKLLLHSRELGGKRLRPALVLLTGKAVGEVSQSHIFAGAALEMIHLATLIHDDVLDDAKERRHRQTAHSKFGVRPGVLLGDYLFTHSFSVGSKTNSIEAVQMLAEASNLVCEGEIKQNAWQSDFTIGEADYFKMVSEKTGELCAVGCGLGAVLSGADSETVVKFSAFGRDLGTAFQVIDDVLDLVGDQTTVGKTLGTDLQNRKVTLPVIHALENVDAAKRELLLEYLSAEKVPVEKVLEILSEAGSVDYARGVAKSIAERSISFANSLEKSDASNALLAIGSMILKRTY